MTHLLAAALVLAVARTPAGSGPQDDIRIMRASRGGPRYVRLRGSIVFAGVRGTETGLIDLATGRYTERVEAGPLSSSDGFDGTRFWSADATGMPIVEGNADARLDALANAHFFGRSGPERPALRRLAARHGKSVIRVTYRSLSGPIDVTLDDASGHVESIVDRAGLEPTRVRYLDYRSTGGIDVPHRIDTIDRYGVKREDVRNVEPVRYVDARAFSPPAPPRDTELDGVTSVPMTLESGRPVVEIRIGNGPVLHVLFDSGASNFVTPAAARRSHLTPVGRDKYGGIGPNLVPQQFATAHVVHLGAATLHDQPFAIVQNADDDLDGTIGCEILQRFAVRFDFGARRVELARDVHALAPVGKALPIRFAGCQPELDGALDELRGAFAVDTGSDSGVDVMSPFVRRYGLIARYHAHERSLGVGIGGLAPAYLARAKQLRLGSIDVFDLPIALDVTTRGAFSDPTQVGNVGVAVLRRFVTTFDYRTSRMWLAPRAGLSFREPSEPLRSWTVPRHRQTAR